MAQVSEQHTASWHRSLQYKNAALKLRPPPCTATREGVLVEQHHTLCRAVQTSFCKQAGRAAFEMDTNYSNLASQLQKGKTP